MDFGLWTLGYGFRVTYGLCGLWTYGKWTLGNIFWVIDPMLWIRIILNPLSA
jgi:hypothetical protein